MISALYVISGGPYYGLKNIDPWDSTRDARKYKGPYPVIAHPPCERWGRYWSGGPSAKTRRLKGDDDGCFAHALWAVRTFGGILEHPEASHAWSWHGLNRPPRNGGWVPADQYGGYTCCVAQGHYGHKAQKLTWLYGVGISLTPLRWGLCSGRQRLDEGFHSNSERKYSKRSTIGERLGKRECAETPIKFRDTLINMIRTP